jgi:ADAMTS-like protein 1/3
VTCGEGIRIRRYECKIFLEFSKIIATIDDSKCHDIKPNDDYERCFKEPCSYAYAGYDDSYTRSNNRDRSNNDQIKVQAAVPGKSYSWRDEGYTSCSASCLGGVEELIINCVRDDTGKVVSPYLCSPETKPENRIRTCNDIPCPPRWNYSDYSPCTKSCGIGIKTREINCIHEVTRGGENTMIVPSSMCPQPPPPDRQYCNVLDCPARWEVGEWERCSKPCGNGYKNRTVLCKQTMAQDHKVGRQDSMCPGAKPQDMKSCNPKPCAPEDDRPQISKSESKYIQHDPAQNKISLKVGGAATIFYGTQVKVKCPVKKYNRTKIKWTKDHKDLPKSRKYKVSKKGALRILDVTFKDGGVYTCHAGLSGADITLTIKPRPGEFPSSEENDRGRDTSEIWQGESRGKKLIGSIEGQGMGSSGMRWKLKRIFLGEKSNSINFDLENPDKNFHLDQQIESNPWKFLRLSPTSTRTTQSRFPLRISHPTKTQSSLALRFN